MRGCPRTRATDIVAAVEAAGEFQSTRASEDARDDRGGPAKYIPWRELLRRIFAIDIKCPRCQGDLRLIALCKTEATIKRILGGMGLPSKAATKRAAKLGAGRGPLWRCRCEVYFIRFTALDSC